MTQRFIRDYFDDEYLQKQELLENLCDDIHTIYFKAIKAWHFLFFGAYMALSIRTKRILLDNWSSRIKDI